jgi:hypothetical protein
MSTVYFIGAAILIVAAMVTGQGRAMLRWTSLWR